MPKVQVVSFHDAGVRVEIRYRLRPSGFRGDADPGRSIADGTLRISTGGTTRSIDLARVLPLARDWVVLPHGPNDGCGALAPIVRTGRYLAIEYVVVGKGCKPSTAFVNVGDGTVVREAQSVEEWGIRHTDGSDRFTTTNGRVVRSEIVTLRRLNDLEGSTTKPWSFGIVTWRDGAGRIDRFSYAVFSEVNAGEATAPPSPGDAVAVDMQDPRAKWYDASTRFRILHRS